MILLSLALGYVMLMIVSDLMKTQEKRYNTKRENDRQRRELREALRQNARMK